jgi:hypothetical protein
MGVVGADRFRPHFLAIEWDDMVDAFKSGRRKLWNVPYTRAPARGMRIARCERDDLHGPDGKSRGAAPGAAPYSRVIYVHPNNMMITRSMYFFSELLVDFPALWSGTRPRAFAEQARRCHPAEQGRRQ